jgi:hypothetical protein
MNSTTRENLIKNPSISTPAMLDYLSAINITAQATYDRWPEANGMRKHLFKLATLAGIKSDQVCYDLDHADVDATGGRW